WQRLDREPAALLAGEPAIRCSARQAGALAQLSQPGECETEPRRHRLRRLRAVQPRGRGDTAGGDPAALHGAAAVPEQLLNAATVPKAAPRHNMNSRAGTAFYRLT